MFQNRRLTFLVSTPLEVQQYTHQPVHSHPIHLPVPLYFDLPSTLHFTSLPFGGIIPLYFVSKPSRQANPVCTDCSAPSPDWVSLNLGVLICIQCSGALRVCVVIWLRVSGAGGDTSCDRFTFFRASLWFWKRTSSEVRFRLLFFSLLHGVILERVNTTLHYILCCVGAID